VVVVICIFVTFIGSLIGTSYLLLADKVGKYPLVFTGLLMTFCGSFILTIMILTHIIKN
jgi:hypothetical protein